LGAYTLSCAASESGYKVATKLGDSCELK
jgi:hypothetical protein